MGLLAASAASVQENLILKMEIKVHSITPILSQNSAFLESIKIDSLPAYFE
jgi:hypothetical protein